MLILPKDFCTTEFIATDAWVLTANRRLSHALQHELDLLKRLHNNSWNTPKILPFHTWLEQTWNYCETSPQLLLNSFQEQCLWESIITQDQHHELLHPQTTAKLVMQAWNLLKLWNLPLDAIKAFDSNEVLAFQRWATRFNQHCQAQHWLSSSLIPQRLLTLIKNNPNALPKTILLFGFDELPPAYHSLLEELKPHCKIHFVAQNQPTTNIQRIELLDTEQELRLMARWAKQQVQLNKKHIACIVPELSEIRSLVETIFTETFELEKIIPGLAHEQNLYTLSAGKALSQYELIHSALLGLKLLKPTIAFETLSALFQTPYFHLTEEDSYLGAQLHHQLCQHNKRSISLPQLFKMLTPLINHYPNSTWLRRLQQAYQIAQKIPQLQSPNAWVKTYCELLNGLHWPGTRSLNSEEYQLHQRWQKIFLEYTTLDTIHGLITLDSALQLLNTLIHDTQFQPKQLNTPIQIMGHLEATGLFFDTMWMMGLHSDNWPPRAKPNPFLPLTLQKQHHMPHATTEREYQYSETVLKRLFSSTHQLILSSPQQQEDQKLHPSQLIRDIPTIDISALQLKSDLNYIQQIQQSSDLEFIKDDQAPPIGSDEYFHRGSKVLKNQSVCPFKAFAEMRLQAQTADEPSFGISATDRGTYTHRALEKIWIAIKTQDQLCAYSPSALNQFIAETVSSVLKDATSSDSEAITHQFLALEQQRLSQLLFEWLEFEKNRPPFKVLQHETKRQVKIGPLTLNVQIDRIDELTTGNHIVIDYKTSKTNLAHWFNRRMRDPQLPLYCVYGAYEGEKKFSGLAFAQLRPKAKEMKFNGILNEHLEQQQFSDLKNIQNHKLINPFSWQQLISAWQNNLHSLACDFYQGYAAVDPLDQDICKTCKLQPLCRIQ